MFIVLPTIPDIRPFIRSVWYFRHDHEQNFQTILQPDHYCDLIWVLNGNGCYEQAGSVKKKVTSSVLFQPQSKSVRVGCEQGSAFLGVRLTPLGYYSIFQRAPVKDAPIGTIHGDLEDYDIEYGYEYSNALLARTLERVVSSLQQKVFPYQKILMRYMQKPFLEKPLQRQKQFERSFYSMCGMSIYEYQALWQKENRNKIYSTLQDQEEFKFLDQSKSNLIIPSIHIVHPERQIINVNLN